MLRGIKAHYDSALEALAAEGYRLPSLADVKLLVGTVLDGGGFKHWHVQVLGNPAPPANECPAIWRFKSEVKEAQQAIVAAFPEFLEEVRTHKEAWPGQFLIQAAALFCRTVMDCCLHEAEEAATRAGRSIGAISAAGMVTYIAEDGHTDAAPDARQCATIMAQAIRERIGMSIDIQAVFANDTSADSSPIKKAALPPQRWRGRPRVKPRRAGHA